jgi:hypothetical protein
MERPAPFSFGIEVFTDYVDLGGAAGLVVPPPPPQPTMPPARAKNNTAITNSFFTLLPSFPAYHRDSPSFRSDHHSDALAR